MESKETEVRQEVETGWQQATRHYRLLARVSDQVLIERTEARAGEGAAEPVQPARSPDAPGGAY